MVLAELNDVQEQVTLTRKLMKPSKLELPDRGYYSVSPKSMKRGFTF